MTYNSYEYNINKKIPLRVKTRKENGMYKNLVKILRDKKITLKAYGEFLGISEKTVQNKVNGRTEFTLGEATKTCSVICPEYKMDFVFEKAETMKSVEALA